MDHFNPYLFVDGAANAIDWYTAHLGAVETLRVSTPDGTIVIHAKLALGDSTLMLADANHTWSDAPSPVGPSSSNLMLYVEDVDAVQVECIAHGAVQLVAVSDKFWGERMGKVRDPFGHVWILATVTEMLSAEAIVERAKAAISA